MTHVIVSFQPFIVRYMHNGLSNEVTYDVPLTTREIMSEYDYVEFEKPKPVLHKWQVWHNNTSNRFSNDVEAKRDLVGVVLGKNENDAFYNAQNDFSETYRRLGVRSTSVGDMIVNLSNGDAYVVQGMGFHKIDKMAQTIFN